jgi:nitroreductase
MGAFGLERLPVPAAEWHEAALTRHSRRQFHPFPLEPEQLDALEELIGVLQPLSQGVRMVVARRVGSDIYRGIVGGYGKVSGALSALVMVGNRGVATVNERVGYIGEALILEATRVGVSTCWVGGFFNRKRTAAYVDMGLSDRIYAVSPLGRAGEAKSSGEKLMSFTARSRSRKGLEVIAPGAETSAWPDWALEGVKAAQIAPSASNRQPWRFRLENGSVVLATDGGFENPVVSRRLDCGIAMLHFELGALSRGCPGGWEFLGGRDVARFRPHTPLPGEEGRSDEG